MGQSKEEWIADEIVERLRDDFVRNDVKTVIRRDMTPSEENRVGRRGQVLNVTLTDGTLIAITVRRFDY